MGLDPATLAAADTAPGTAHPPAPVELDEVRLSLAPFGESRMLPRAAYLDDVVLEWERRHVFSDWVCVGRADDLRSPRTASAHPAGEASVLLTRDAAGELHAFENACRHRGHELLPCGGRSETRLLACPYHAWTYNHDGSLRHAPGYPRDGSFDLDRFGLHELPVRQWHGWVFVNPSGTSPAFDRHVGDLEQVVAHYDGADLVTVTTHTYEVAANWKLVVENYQECYHCSSIHPELCRVSTPQSGENLQTSGDWVGGWMALRDGVSTMSLDGHSNGTVMARLDERQKQSVMYAVLLPNLLMSLHPDYVMTHLLFPVGPAVTRIECSWAFPRATAERPGFDPAYAVDFWDLTNRQDWAACESVQRGIRAPGFVPGPLAPAEDGVYHFVTKLARRYLGHGA